MEPHDVPQRPARRNAFQNVLRQCFDRRPSVRDHAESDACQALAEAVDVRGHVENGRGFLQFRETAAQTPFGECAQAPERQVHLLSGHGLRWSRVGVDAEEHIQSPLVLVQQVPADLHSPGTVIAHQRIVEFTGIGQHVEGVLGERIGQHDAINLGLREREDILLRVLGERVDRMLVRHGISLRSSFRLCSFIR